MSNCLETEGSVCEVTSDCLSCSGILNLEAAVKDRTGKEEVVMKVGFFVQDWVMEMREATDVRVRLVENIVRNRRERY